MKQLSNRELLETKYVFCISLTVMALTVLSVWLLGLGSQRTLIENSFLSLVLISTFFFLFIFIGLYRGFKLKDNIGKVTDQFDVTKIEFLRDFTPSSSDVPDVGDGIVGSILSVIIWFLLSILIGFLFWAFGAILWIMILVFVGMLYWIFFRALRMVFRKAPACKGQLDQSLLYSIYYTTIYTFWFFGLLFFAQNI